MCRRLWEASRLLDLVDPFRIGAERGRVVELLEGLAATVSARHLADEENERRRVLEGGVHAGRRMCRPGRTGGEANTGAAGQLAVGFGHVRGAGLVARDDEPDGRVPEGIEGADIALAGNAEHRVDAVHDELVDEDPRPRAGHRSIGWSKKTVACCRFGFASSAEST